MAVTSQFALFVGMLQTILIKGENPDAIPPLIVTFLVVCATTPGILLVILSVQVIFNEMGVDPIGRAATRVKDASRRHMQSRQRKQVPLGGNVQEQGNVEAQSHAAASTRLDEVEFDAEQVSASGDAEVVLTKRRPSHLADRESTIAPPPSMRGQRPAASMPRLPQQQEEIEQTLSTGEQGGGSNSARSDNEHMREAPPVHDGLAELSSRLFRRTSEIMSSIIAPSPQAPAQDVAQYSQSSPVSPGRVIPAATQQLTRISEDDQDDVMPHLVAGHRLSVAGESVEEIDDFLPVVAVVRPTNRTTVNAPESQGDTLQHV